MKKTLVLVLALALLAFALRIFQLDAISLRGDEAFTVIFVQRTWEGLWKGIRTVEPNPPLLYLTLRAWVAVAGAGEFATRYFSLFFGVLCVPLLYRLARELFRGQSAASLIGLTAAVLITINPYQIWHSQDVRNYTLWQALSLAALVFFWLWWKKETQMWNARARDSGPQSRAKSLLLLSYVLATLASLYTHYYDTFVLIALNVFVLVAAFLARRWRTLMRWTVAQIILAVLYVPWVLFGTNRVTTYGEGSAYQSVSLLDQFSRTLATFVLSDTVPDIFKSLFWLPLALFAAAVLFYVARANRTHAFFLLLYIAVPSLALYVISIGRPLFLERYLNGIAPAYYLVFAVGIVALWGRGIERDPWEVWQRLRLSTLAVVLLFFVSTAVYALDNYYFDPRFAKAPNWRAVGQFISTHHQAGDIVVQNFTEMAAIYYLQGALPVITVPRDYSATAEDVKVLERLNQDYGRIWFMPAAPDFWDDVHFVEKYLSRYDDRVLDTRFSDVRLQLYQTPHAFASSINPVNARVGNATLVGYRVDGLVKGTTTTSGAANLRVVLYWRAERKIERDYTVFVHLADSTERIFAQQDSAPVFGTWQTTAWQTGELVVDAYDLSADLTSGTFPLYVGMYDPASHTRVPAFDSGGAPLSDNRVLLTQVTVVP